jgi:hypothetical protein
LEIEKALLLLNPKNDIAFAFNLVGIEKLFDLMSNPVASALLMSEYGITEKEFHKRLADIRTFEPPPPVPAVIAKIPTVLLVKIILRRLIWKFLGIKP